MANVLGELFQEIADSIRAKTGGTGKLIPSNFPSEILSIPLVANGGEAADGGLKIAGGSFTVSSDAGGRQTVTHGLGEMPDFVLVSAMGFQDTEITEKTFRLISAWGFHSKFADLTHEVKGGYSAHGFWINEDTGVYNETAWCVTSGGYGIDNLPASSRNESTPLLYAPNDTTFEVGANSTFLFVPGISYAWIALSGLGGTYPSAETMSF